MVVMVVAFVMVCQFLGRRPQPAGQRGNLRIARRQANRNCAIRVHQEPITFCEEVYYTLKDTFDGLIYGVCELGGAVRSGFQYLCGGGSMEDRMGQLEQEGANAAADGSTARRRGKKKA